MERLKITLLALILFTTPLGTYAASCAIPSHTNLWGDTIYSPRACSQSLVNKYWNDFNFDKGDWDEGFGYYDSCNINKPLNRTFSALWLLHRSTPNPTTSTNDFNGNFLRWAYNYSAREIDELDARCGDGTAFARNYRGAFVDDRTELYLGFFYQQGVPERAGTIVHEARHADGKGHDSCNCPRNAGCDQRWGANKANDYHVKYLWWFIDRGVNTTTSMKRRAQDKANQILSQAFCEATSFRLNYSL